MQEIVIDVNSRQLLLPSSLTSLGVVGDKDVQRLRFLCPRYYFDCDFSNYDICILFKNNDKEPGKYEVSDKTTDDENITFSWLVGEEALEEAGITEFSVCMSVTNTDGKELNDFNTAISRLLVLEGLPDE